MAIASLRGGFWAMLLFGAGCLAGIPSCKTEDVDPVVSISVDSAAAANRLSEDRATVWITATLNGVAKKDVRVHLTFAGTATQSTDYTIAGTEIVVPAGSLKGSVAVMSLQDTDIEGDETILVMISSPENAQMFDSDQVTIIISDDDVDTDNDGVVDALDGCPLDSGAVANGGCMPGFGLVLNEILYDPADGTAGDANGDGVRDPNADEFLEFFNSTSVDQDISGFSISDSVISSNTLRVRYRFPAGTIVPARKAIVVFGGGTPAGSFGGAQVVESSSTLSLGSSGEHVLVKDPSERLIIDLNTDAFSDAPNESYTRKPDMTGGFVQHHEAVAGKLFSPGTKADGTTF